jgi:anti-sigma regulatory factor (Ser/Thr protein kinase)
MDEYGTLELTLAPEPGSVAEARTKVCAALEPALADGMVQTLKLLVSEVVTNAVRHGSSAQPVELHAEWNSEVRVEVSDSGEGFTPTPRAGPLEEPGGFGLFLVGHLADRWGVETNDGTTVWFVLRRP